MNYSKVVALPGKDANQIYSQCTSGIDKLQEKFQTSSPIAFEIIKNPAQKTIDLKSSWVSANLKVEAGKATLTAKISFLALPFKAKIEENLDRWIQKTFQV